MTDFTWDPHRYARYADERSRPFADLISRVRADDARTVVDLGCGDGPLTIGLAERWPGAHVVGVDHSPEMLSAAAAAPGAEAVEWVLADLATWDPTSLPSAPDVLVSNAALQWVPDHLDLLPVWAEVLAPGGWLALQVPGNHDAPSHRLMREVATDLGLTDALTAAESRPRGAEPQDYLEVLGGCGLAVDVWETTYHHVLRPEGATSPVLDWVRGTGLRPVLAALTDVDEREAFLAEYDRRLRAAYPLTPSGVVLPFRRVFAVAHTRPIESTED